MGSRSKVSAEQVRGVRDFNRFYTARIGILDEVYLDSDFSLSEGRLLYEVWTRGEATARELMKRLAIDEGYLSRTLKRLEGLRLLTRSVDPVDRRKLTIRLTPAGKKAITGIDRRSDAQVSALLAPLSAADQRRLLIAMKTIKALLALEP